jgi:phosphonate transport system substrate-binding protein
MKKYLLALALLGVATGMTRALAQDNCPNRGDLDVIYCDADQDLVADPPTDPKKFHDPYTLAFAFTPVEDPSIYEKLFQPFMDHLAQCVGKKTIFFPIQTPSAQIEAMRSGRLHVAAFSTGPTKLAVNIAGAVPFAIRGTAGAPAGVSTQLIVRKDSPYKKIADLKGKKVAHVTASSNSGNLVPRALFPALGLTPEKDYPVIYSGKHDQSILGVKSGKYDAAPVADDVLRRMIERGEVRADDFNTLYVSENFPSDAYTYAHDLEPKLVEKIRNCFFDYKIPPEMARGLGGDRFLPASYQKDWEIVRKVSLAASQNSGRGAQNKGGK